MELPQHWAKASGFSPHLGAAGGELEVWGWSETSELEAEGVARARLAEALERIAVEGRLPAGHGYYPRMPLREPVLEEVLDDHGQRIAAITRNRMGCEVLCTDTLFIADVDVPGLEEESTPEGGGSGIASGLSGSGVAELGAQVVGGLLGRLRKRVLGDAEPTPMAPTAGDGAPGDRAPGGSSAAAASSSAAELRACEPVWEFSRRHPELGVRVYRTSAGLRVLVTGAQAPPMSERARELLTELGSDPLYVELCATHDSYRARLTPKPFRVGLSAPSWRWPFADEQARYGLEEWVAGYREATGGYAVCRLVSASGAIPGVDEQKLVALHDERCRVGSGLPLA